MMRIIPLLAILLAGCGERAADPISNSVRILRECSTVDGQRFRYYAAVLKWSDGGVSRFEDIERMGPIGVVYDTNGWSRAGSAVASCRDVPAESRP